MKDHTPAISVKDLRGLQLGLRDVQTTHRPVQIGPRGESLDDIVAIEEPLEIRVEGAPLAVTMRTPGHDLDLAAGFLFTEGIIEAADDLDALAETGDPTLRNRVDAVLAAGTVRHEAIAFAQRSFFATSSCGLCGKSSIDRVKVATQQPIHPLSLDAELLCRLPDLLAGSQVDFAATGGLHAAALVTPAGEVEVLREDVGRHNAVDKVIGARVRADAVPIPDRVLVVSSRASFEIVQKARVAGIPAIVCMGAASSLAIDLAVESGQTLVGFVRPHRWVVYA